MKLKSVLGLAAVLSAAGLQAADNDPVVMTIAGKDVTASEFEYFYNKNDQEDLAEKKTFDEYIDLFINYKLKVAEAAARGVDTTKAFRDELAGYRRQLAEPYMKGEDWQDSLVFEFVERNKYKIHAQHILLMTDQNAPAEQVARKKARIMELKAEAEAGADFDSLARANSEEPGAAQRAGDLGYFSAGQMVYPFETVCYETPVGGYGVCRSQYGFHLVKVIDRAPKSEQRLVAHIMKVYSRPQTVEKMKECKAQIDSLYALLQGGADFAQLAAQNSDDSYTARDGGQYPWIDDAARFPQEWLTAAFALKNEGDISQPVQTAYGWHILKLNGIRKEAPVTSQMRDELRQQLPSDPERAKVGKALMVRQWKTENRFEENTKVFDNLVKMSADTALSREEWNKKVAKIKKPLFTINGEKYAARDFADEVPAGVEPRWMDIRELADAWEDKAVEAYQEAHLSEKYPDYAHLYQEYHDGIMLFDVAGKEVWDKAAEDSTGLHNYFLNHRHKYDWEKPRFRGAFIECANDSALVAKLKGLYEHNDWKKAAELVRLEVLSDTLLTPDPKHPRFHIVNGLYSIGDNQAVDMQQLGQHPQVIHAPKPEMPIQMTYGTVLPTGPESEDDVRALVIGDYQTELEDQWVARLREKYSWTINQTELDKLRK